MHWAHYWNYVHIHGNLHTIFWCCNSFSQCRFLFLSKKKADIYEWVSLCKYSDFIWFLATNYQLESNHNFQHLFLPRPFKNCIHYWYLDTILKYVVCTLLKPCTKLKYIVSHFFLSEYHFAFFSASGTWHMYRYSSNVSIVSIQGDFIDFFSQYIVPALVANLHTHTSKLDPYSFGTIF